MSKPDKYRRGKRVRLEGNISGNKSDPGFASINFHSTSSSVANAHDQRFGLFRQLTDAPSLDRAGPQLQRALNFMPTTPVGKVAIPSLRSPQIAGTSTKFKKGRTAHACDTCRRAKAGCTGGTPCQRCSNTKVECIYGDGKRDRDKKALSRLSRDTNTLSQQNSEILLGIRRLRTDNSLSPAEIRAGLDELIARMPVAVSSGESPSGKVQSEQEPIISEDEDDGDEAGSTGSIDIVNFDTDRDDLRARGHLGKSSSVCWATRSLEEYRSAHPNSTAVISEGAHPLASYHTEDADLQDIDTSHVNPFEWPAPDQYADLLLDSYFEHIHNTLPLVNKLSFKFYYDRFKRGSETFTPDDNTWLGTLNLIFAVTSLYFRLSKHPSQAPHTDHLIYLARARLLLQQEFLFKDPRISTTSALGLMSLYFLASCRINRAWPFGGLAIRHALTLGLNNRNESLEISEFEREYRIRLWWSLFSLECTLNQLTGRPTCISDRDISTPLPADVDEVELFASASSSIGPFLCGLPDSKESKGKGRGSDTYYHKSGIPQPLAYTFPVLSSERTPSTYFICRTQLSILSHEIIKEIYCPSAIRDKWADTQDRMHHIHTRLVSWEKSLPLNFGIDFNAYSNPDWNDPRTTERLGLAMLFNSSRMILFRPCLCRFEGRKKGNYDSDRIGHQTARLRDFNQSAVKICISSARKMIELLGLALNRPSSITPPSPSIQFHSIMPFWSTLNDLCQALSVLILEVAFLAHHVPENEAPDIIEDAKKGIRWLTEMAAQSISARKAWEIFDCLVRLVAPMINWSVFDLPTHAPIPPCYNLDRFSAAVQTPGSQQQHQQETFMDTAWGAEMQEPLAFPIDQSPAYGTAANPLNHEGALQLFERIGGMHSRFDEPWTHIFNPMMPSNLVPPETFGETGDFPREFGMMNFEEHFPAT